MFNIETGPKNKGGNPESAHHNPPDPITGQYRTESSPKYIQAARNAGLGVEVLQPDQILNPQNNLTVSEGFVGVRVHLNRPEDADTYWAEYKKLADST